MTTLNKNQTALDFKHRFEGDNDGGLFFYYESMKASLERARSVCDCLGSVKVDGLNIWRLTQTIENEIKDAEMMLVDYFNQQLKEKKASPETH